MDGAANQDGGRGICTYRPKGVFKRASNQEGFNFFLNGLRHVTNFTILINTSVSLSQSVSSHLCFVFGSYAHIVLKQCIFSDGLFEDLDISELSTPSELPEL